MLPSGGYLISGLVDREGRRWVLGPRLTWNETGMTIFPYEVRVGFGLSMTSSGSSQPAPTSSIGLKIDGLLMLTASPLSG